MKRYVWTLIMHADRDPEVLVYASKEEALAGFVTWASPLTDDGVEEERTLLDNGTSVEVGETRFYLDSHEVDL